MVGHNFSALSLALCSIALVACGGDDTTTGASGGGSTTTDASSTTAGSTSTSPTTGSSSTTEEPTSTGSASGSTTDVTTGSSTTDITTGPPPACGDGVVDDGEQCDDGNADDTDACTSACQNAACGDAVVQAGVEECDDGNVDDTDTCTNACTNAVCGDGIVGPGEACDDGNQVDDDECTNLCAAASCGDGIVKAGAEECDDGNQVDTDACLNTCLLATCGDMVVQEGVEACDDGNDVDADACLSTCVAAACGDMVVQDGVEQCDDGNDVDDDGCSNMCALPTCTDKAKNGGETDIDCGGPTCPKCGLGLACGGNADCGVGVCLKNKCVSNKSCKALYDGDNTLPNGKYTLDPDEAGPGQPFEAFCGMQFDGGGWTLIMKSIGTNFHYDDPLWENEMTLNPTNFDFVMNNTKAKYQTFHTVGFSAIRTTSTTDFNMGLTQTLQAPVASARALFQGPAIEVNKTVLNTYLNNLSAAYDKHSNFCNPSTKYVNFGFNLKKLNGVNALPDGGFCDWNGGARFGQRVNGDHNATGNHAGQGWGTYTTINNTYVANISQLLWVR